MALAYLGSLTLGQCFPYALTASADLNASLGVALPELEAKLAGLLQLQVALTIGPPQLTATIQAALAVVASLQASIGGPSITLQVGAVAALVADIRLTLGSLSVDFSAELAVLLSVGGVYAYSYTGTVAGLGADLDAALTVGIPGGPAPGAACGALVFIAAASAPRVALGTFCGVNISTP